MVDNSYVHKVSAYGFENQLHTLVVNPEFMIIMRPFKDNSHDVVSVSIYETPKNIKNLTDIGLAENIGAMLEAQNIVPQNEAQLHYYNKKIVDEFKLVLCDLIENGQDLAYGPRFVVEKVDGHYVDYNPKSDIPPNKIELLDLDPAYLAKLHMLSLRI